MKKILLIAPLIALCGCTTTKDEDLPEVVVVKKIEPYHSVNNGETVGDIANKYNMKRSELIAINGLTPPYQLYQGQRLIVRVSAESNLGGDIKINSAETAEDNPPTDVPAVDAEQTTDLTPNETVDVLPEQDAAIEVDEVKVAVTDKVWPIDSARTKISQHFGDSKFDEGIVIKASAGTSVKAMAPGIVKLAKTPDGEAAAYGMTVIIKHDKLNMLTVYSHLQENSVKVGQSVSKGQSIGKVGNTGKANTPQLYFEIFDIKDGKRVSLDPEKILP